MFKIVGEELGMEELVPFGTLYLTSQRWNDTTTVTVAGELDISTADQLQAYAEEALRSAPRRLVLDLSGVSFFSAAGITVLSALVDSAAADGTELLLGEVSSAVTRVLGTLGMAGHYPSAAVVDDGLRITLPRSR
jgi:stage II sporulation protein AA (anti-sigma F factor antagonist)